MTQDEIICFAIQCRLVTTGNRDGLYMDALTEFANLVAAKEREALAQTQEPVAWMHVQGNYKEPSFRELADDEVERGWEQYPLYNTPPQRPWVGLTDDEIAQGWKESWVTEQAWQSAVWWAEAKLKEKNT